jgi:predicted dehydrogenase
MTYGLAVIGTGYMARKHCEALAVHPDARLTAICSTDRSRETAAGFKSLYGFVHATTDYSSILSDSDIDVVFICSPDNLHTEQVCAALQAGKHVFCEKPLARTKDDFHKIAKALKNSGRILQVGMNCRFRDQYSRARDMVLAGELGSLRFLRGTYIVNAVASVRQREKPWWADFPAGVSQFLHGGGIHCLDLLRWMGGEVDSVFARATGLELGPQLGADTFSISIQFASGAIGELLVAGSAFRPNDFSLELWLSGGSILGTKIFRRVGDSVPAKVEEITVEQKTIDLGLQFSDTVRAIQSGSDPLNSFAEAEQNFMVLQAIEESVRTGNAVNIIQKTGRDG